MRRLRFVAALVAAASLLPGCVQPPEEEDDPLVGLCPAWLQGPGEARVAAGLGAARESNATAEPPGAAAANWSHQGRILDLYQVTLDRVAAEGGAVEMRAYSEGRQLRLRDFREAEAQLKPVVVLGPGDEGREFDVLLSPLTEEAPPQPGPLELRWGFAAGSLVSATASVEATVTFHYRVCGP